MLWKPAHFDPAVVATAALLAVLAVPTQASSGDAVVLASGQIGATGIAVDDTHVYFGNDSDGTIKRVPKAGGAVETLSETGFSTVLTIDATHVYWVVALLPAGRGEVWKVPKEGGTPELLADGETRPNYVVVDESSVYWTVQILGLIRTVPISGGAPTTFASDQAYPLDLAIDSQFAYWTNELDGTVMRAEKAGGSPTVLAATGSTGSNSVMEIAVDATAVYWTAPATGRVLKVAKGGGSVEVLASGVGFPMSLTLDDGFVYWASRIDGTIGRVRKTGGSPEILASGQGRVHDVAADGRAVYWATPDAGNVLRLALAASADAGPDQTVNEGDTVCLNGAASSGSVEAYSWEQLAGCPATLDDPASPCPCFTAPDLPGGASGSCTLTFQLTVTDDGGQSSSDTVDVTVKNVNKRPVADAGSDQAVKEGSPVTLSAENSYDPDADPIVSYQWSQIGGQTVILTGDNTAQPSFAAPLLAGGFGTSEALTFEVTVSDGELSAKDVVQVTVEQVNHPPSAHAGPDQTKFEGSAVALDGMVSSDPDGDGPLSYVWSQLSGPTVGLSDATGPSPTFTAPAVGPGGATLVFRLRVFDGQLWNDPLADPNDEVTITVQNLNDPPACGLAQASPPILWPPNHKLMTVGIAGVTDPNDDQVAIAVTDVTQDEPANGLGDGDTSPDAVVDGAPALLRAERSGVGNGRVYRVSFTADDGDGGICTGTVQVGVPLNMRPGASPVDDGQNYRSTGP